MSDDPFAHPTSPNIPIQEAEIEKMRLVGLTAAATAQKFVKALDKIAEQYEKHRQSTDRSQRTQDRQPEPAAKQDNNVEKKPARSEVPIIDAEIVDDLIDNKPKSEIEFGSETKQKSETKKEKPPTANVEDRNRSADAVKNPPKSESEGVGTAKKNSETEGVKPSNMRSFFNSLDDNNPVAVAEAVLTDPNRVRDRATREKFAGLSRIVEGTRQVAAVVWSKATNLFHAFHDRQDLAKTLEQSERTQNLTMALVKHFGSEKEDGGRTFTLNNYQFVQFADNPRSVAISRSDGQGNAVEIYSSRNGVVRDAMTRQDKTKFSKLENSVANILKERQEIQSQIQSQPTPTQSASPSRSRSRR